MRRFQWATDLYGDTRIGNQIRVTYSKYTKCNWRSRLDDRPLARIPDVILQRRRCRTPGNSAAGVIAGARSFFINSAQAVRAILKATATSFGGLSILASHEPASRRHPDMAPVISTLQS